MPSTADIQQVIEYYTNLLIIQYNNRPKAQATIRLLIDELYASGILLDVRDAYSVETAVGVQLDVIGDYVGVSRFFTVHDPINYFALTDYDEVDPDAEEKWGFTTYADFEDYQYNGTLNYMSILSLENTLNDDDFRVIIKLKILQNNSNHSHKSINDGMYKFFGNEVRPSSNGNMTMAYFISVNITAVILAALTKQILPRPMGVGLTLIENVTGDFFSFYAYGGVPTDHTIGFTTYDDYDTTEGQYLSYEQMTGA